MLIYMKGNPDKSLCDMTNEGGRLGEEGKDYHRIVGEVKGREAWGIPAEDTLSIPDEEIGSMLVDIGLIGASDASREEVDAFLALEEVQDMLFQLAKLRNRLVLRAQEVLNLDFVMTYDLAGIEHNIREVQKAKAEA